MTGILQVRSSNSGSWGEEGNAEATERLEELDLGHAGSSAARPSRGTELEQLHRQQETRFGLEFLGALLERVEEILGVGDRQGAAST